MADYTLQGDEVDIFFKKHKPLVERKELSERLLSEHPGRIPIIIERADNEKFLPPLNKKRFLVPEETSLTHLYSVVRHRLQLHQDQSFFLLVAGRNMPALSSSMESIYKELKDEDGFLYMTFASQEVFG